MQMKSVQMFMMAGCPYCKKAARYMDELMEEHPEYKEIPLKIIDENLEPEVANSYDYYLVPTYYVDGEKVHEGAASKEDVRQVFERAGSD